MMRDLKSNILAQPSLNPAAEIDATATGTGVDLRGYDSATALVHIGTVTGTWTPSLEESDDDSTYSAVDAADLIGEFEAVTTANDNAVQEVGYRGNARYIRVVLTETATGTAFVAGSIVLGHPHQAPTA